MTPELAADLAALGEELLAEATGASSGRASRAVLGGPSRRLRHVLVALAGGSELAEHANPGEATVHVLRGRVRLTSGGDSLEGGAGALLVVPDARHGLHALEPSVVLLTAVPRASE